VKSVGEFVKSVKIQLPSTPHTASSGAKMSRECNSLLFF